MTEALALPNEIAEPGLAWRRWAIVAGRISLALLLLCGWEFGARYLGPLLLAPPLGVLARLGTLAQSGALFTDIAATLRVAVLGFVIGCVLGALLPLVPRHSARLTAALEPYILASQGIPKYALMPWLIMWFGIGDLPKLVVVTLIVFYVVFITTLAGVRSVDGRLIDMARIMGAGESAIARKIVWMSLLPYFFTGLKIAMPRAVSATIVGEFLVGTEGVGRYIEHAREISDTVGVFAGIVVATALVLAINTVLNVIERHALRWRPVEREMEL
jgi:NitT/TauT family transport system permease protein